MKMINRTGLKYFIVAAILALSLVLALSACASEKSTETPAGDSGTPDTSAVTPEPEPSAPAPAADAQVIASGDNLIIPVSEVSETAKFYPIDVDDTTMEILAVQASDGTIRTAFNTCQVCFDSGRGYYKQQGDKLVCQNCGNSFTADMVEVAAGGCNPYPIFDGDKTVADDSITISYDFLSASTKVFAHWKS